MKQPHESELLKAYCAFVLIEAVLSVLVFFLFPQPTSIAEAMNQTSLQKTVGILLGVYSFALFIFSIVVWVRFRKEQWSWKLKLLPKLRVIIPVIMFIIGAAISAKNVAKYVQSAPALDPNTPATPEQLQALVPASAMTLSTISLGITVALGIYALSILLHVLKQKHTAEPTPSHTLPTPAKEQDSQ